MMWTHPQRLIAADPGGLGEFNYFCVDAGGYFARSAEVLRRVGDVLLDPSMRGSGGPLRRWLVAKDAFDLADGATGNAIYQVRPGALLCCNCNSPLGIIAGHAHSAGPLHGR